MRREKYTSGEVSLRPDQVDELLSVIDDLTYLALFKLAVSCGIRRGDIVGLKWKDVNLDKNELKFYEKKKDRVKTVYFSDSVAQTLKLLRNEQEGKEYYLFPGRSNMKYGKGHVSESTVYRRFQTFLVKAGIQGEEDRKPFHALRATCYKLCQSAGWSVEQAAKHIGDTVRVAQEHYATPSDEEMKGAATEKPIL